MNERVLFLDIDGVLNGREWFSSPLRKMIKGSNSEPSRMISRRNLFWLGLFCFIKKPKVILSSSWRYFWDDNGQPSNDETGQHHLKTDKLLRKFGVNIVGKTCNQVTSLGKHEYNQELLDEFVKRYNRFGFLDKDGNKVVKSTEEILEYTRGAQILKWIEDNNFTGNYVILEDDWSDVLVYKELEKHIVITKFYGKFPGFGFKHFIRALRILK